MCVGGWMGGGVVNGWVLWHEMSKPIFWEKIRKDFKIVVC